MPILVRPVREQLEHDRIIRLLQARYKKKHDPVANVGGEPPTSMVIGTAEFVPDLILLTNDKARKLDGVVEVETGESVNSLETLAQWGPSAACGCRSTSTCRRRRSTPCAGCAASTTSRWRSCGPTTRISIRCGSR